VAKLVVAAGISHSPLLASPAEYWLERGQEDRNNTELYDHEGRLAAFEQLEEQAAGRFSPEIEIELIQHRWKLCQKSLDRVQDEFVAARPDLVVLIGDDQRELFDSSNSPALATYVGETISMMAAPGAGSNGSSGFWGSVWQAYGMDPPRQFPAAPEQALHLSRELAAAGFDLGLAIRAAIEKMSGDLRVGIVASGGLSHFVVNEALDMEVLAALHGRDQRRLTSLPTNLLDSGSSEIRNWIALGGAVSDTAPVWSEYVPCYRSAAGTGCGMGFATWSVAGPN
jgi:hypothetical protein